MLNAERKRALTMLAAPFLILEDFRVFLDGGTSLFGRACNEIFGAGGAKKVRENFEQQAREIFGRFVE